MTSRYDNDDDEEEDVAGIRGTGIMRPEMMP